MHALIILNWHHGIVQEYSPFYCKNSFNFINRTINANYKYDFNLIINDKHTSDDNEFCYYPEHNLDFYSKSPLKHISSLKQPKQLLYKTTPSAFVNDHNYGVLKNLSPSSITVVGFSLCFDILPTILHLYNYFENVKLMGDCCGCVDEAWKFQAIEYLKFIGIEDYASNNFQ